MSDIGLVDWFLLLALCLTTILIVRSGLAQVASAFHTGRLRGRGAVYERQAQPLMFWRGVAFWIVISVAMVALNVFAALRIFRVPV